MLGQCVSLRSQSRIEAEYGCIGEAFVSTSQTRLQLVQSAGCSGNRLLAHEPHTAAKEPTHL